MKKKIIQPEVNIGVVGHVDHGKTTIVKALTGEWADRHSEELKRGITIYIGYADAAFYKCEESGKYTNNPQECKKAKFLRKVSFVDCPGHEALMATTLSATPLMDGAMLVIAANEPCPQPQTQEHLMALNIAGIKNIVIVQNKIDLVSKEKALEHYNQIKEFVLGSVAENAPIIPTSAHFGINLDALIEAIEKNIPTPKRDQKKPARMLVVRSFDINKPGTKIKDLKGGVLGGSLIQGKLKVGDEIEIRPGIGEPIYTEVYSLATKEGVVEQAGPGGLIAVQTGLDPSFTKQDQMVGNVIGKPDTLPPIRSSLSLDITLFEKTVALPHIEPLKNGEIVVINAWTAATLGKVINVKRDYAEIQLKEPICIEDGERVTISRKIGTRWRLIGYGVVK